MKFLEAASGNTGEHTSGGRGSKVDLSPEIEGKERFIFPKKINRLELFRDVIRHIESSPDVTNLRLISINGHLGKNSQYSYFPASYTEKNRQRTWRYTDKKCSKEHLRRAITVEFGFKAVYVCLIEVERRIELQEGMKGWVELDDVATLMIVSEKPQIAYARAKSLFQSCSDNSGVWQTKEKRPQNHENSKTLILRHPAHDSVLDKSYASKFTNYILNKLTNQD